MTPVLSLDRRVVDLLPSATTAISEGCARLRGEGRTVYNFGLGQSPFPVPGVVVDALRANAHEKAYLAVSGLPALRGAVAGYLARTEGIDYAPENLLVGPGSKELLFLLQVVHEGDLLIPTPGWVSYAPQARILGRQPVLLPTRREDDYQLDPDLLDSVLQRSGHRSRILILNYPGNPTGATLTHDRLKAIAAVAAKHRMIVLSDEIYGPLQYEGEHRSIAQYYPEGTIVSTGLSKWCGAGGWRLGVMAFPQSLSALRSAMVAVASETFTSTSAPIQHAAVVAFEGCDELVQYLASCRRVLAGLGAWCWHQLRGVGADAPRPCAAFYLFADFHRHRQVLRAKGIASADMLADALLEQVGVAALPGSVFGVPPDQLTIRFSLVDFEGGQALAQLDSRSVGETFIRGNCARVVAGVEALGSWVRDLY